MSDDKKATSREIETGHNYNENIRGDYHQNSGSSTQIVNITKKSISIATATLVAMVSVTSIIFAGNNIINIGKENEGTIEIFQGDPPEVRQRKTERAKELIADEVYANILNIDGRLGFVRSILVENENGEAIEKNNKLLPPALQDYSDSKYRGQKFNLDISLLRSIYNDYPVSEISKSLTQVLIDTKTNPKQVRLFSDSLIGVRNASEWLETTLSNAANVTPTDSKIIAYHNKQINHAIERLNNNYEQSYVFGLMLLDSLGTSLSEVQKNLSNLKHLEAPYPIGKDDINRVLQESKRLEEKERYLLQGQKKLIEDEKNKLSESKEDLTIQPSDTWNQVSAKAIALRQLGYLSESVDAFSLYGEMFTEEDPTALQYSQTAQQFTIQLEKLGIDGGVYLYEVPQNQADNKADLKVGDIIVQYGDEKIVKVEDMRRTIQNLPKNSHNQLTYLRMNNAEEFKRQTVTINSDPLVVGMMPI